MKSYIYSDLLSRQTNTSDTSGFSAVVGWGGGGRLGGEGVGA